MKITSKERKKELLANGLYSCPYVAKSEVAVLPGTSIQKGKFDGFGKQLMKGAFAGNQEEVFEKFEEVEQDDKQKESSDEE